MKNINRDEWHFTSKGDFPVEDLDGSFIVCQNSKAFSRHSHNHSGSPFFAEIIQNAKLGYQLHLPGGFGKFL